MLINNLFELEIHKTVFFLLLIISGEICLFRCSEEFLDSIQSKLLSGPIGQQAQQATLRIDKILYMPSTYEQVISFNKISGRI